MILTSKVVFAEGRASNNDVELKLLFGNLIDSQSASVANKIVLEIWKIWINDGASDLSRSRMERGINLMNQGHLGAAEKLFTELIATEPNYIEAWNKRATVRFLMGQLGASLEDVSVVLSKEPKHFGAVSGLGLILMKTEDFEGALDAYNKVLEINPYSKDALHLIPILEQRVLGKKI